MKDEGEIISVRKSNKRSSKFEGKRGRVGKKLSDNAYACPLYYLLASIST